MASISGFESHFNHKNGTQANHALQERQGTKPTRRQEQQECQQNQQQQESNSKESWSLDAVGDLGALGGHDQEVLMRRTLLAILRKRKTQSFDFPNKDELRAIWKSNDRTAKMSFAEFQPLASELWLLALPLGQGDLADAIKEADSIPSVLDINEFDSQPLRRLANLCFVLQSRAGAESFYLCSKSLEAEFGCDRTTIARLLRALAYHKVIERTYAGHTNRASEYRFLLNTKQIKTKSGDFDEDGNIRF